MPHHYWTQLGNICHCLSAENCHYTESLRKQLGEKSVKNWEVCLHFLVMQQHSVISLTSLNLVWTLNVLSSTNSSFAAWIFFKRFDEKNYYVNSKLKTVSPLDFLKMFWILWHFLEQCRYVSKTWASQYWGKNIPLFFLSKKETEDWLILITK